VLSHESSKKAKKKKITEVFTETRTGRIQDNGFPLGRDRVNRGPNGRQQDCRSRGLGSPPARRSGGTL